MCAFLRSTEPDPRSPQTAGIRPESEADEAQPRLTSRRPPFLAKRSRNAKGVLIGGAALAGVAAVSAAALATVVLGRAARRRSNGLFGKTVLITGSSRGLGLAMAEEFARRGARVVLTARDEEELERARGVLLSNQVMGGPDQVMVIAADLRRPEAAEYLIDRVTRAWGHLDILVNNAGIITVGPIENQSVQDFHEVMETNFFTGLHCTLAALPQMLERKAGMIVNITSIGGKVAVPHLLPYTASKFAAVGFSEGLHAELRGKGVHVLTVVPGLMRTGSHVNALFSGDAEKEYRWFSLGATTPGASTSARHAARKIVRAVIARETEIAITPQAILAARLSQLSPEITSRVMGMMNKVLPDAEERKAPPVRGMDARRLEPVPAKSIGWAAARRYNEIGTTGAKG